jgi:hypothetical protein
VAACERGARTETPAADDDPARVLAGRVSAHYASGDARAAGAWTWIAEDGTAWVLVDVQSTVDGLVQGRLDLWLVGDSTEAAVGRSDVMASAAEIGAYLVGDLTGDGLPDLFGYVADSADVRYPVFLPGARGSLVDALAAAAPGWQFDVLDPNEPAVEGGFGGPCAVRIWAQEPAPDGRPAGWRWLRIRPGGELSAPGTEAVACP